MPICDLIFEAMVAFALSVTVCQILTVEMWMTLNVTFKLRQVQM